MHNPGSHLSKDMLELIKSIGDSRSKQEEDKIIIKEKDTLKVKIKESSINPKKMKEYLLRAIYVEMLGHDAPFAHLYSVNLTQDKNILNKRVGYLACNILLSESSEFLIMLVASLQKDIQSSNWVEVCMALTSVVKFANSTIIQAVVEPIMKLLDNKNEQIRKKAAMCLYKFYQVNPVSVPDCDDRMRRLLCDYDPSVMAATLCYFHEVSKKTPEKYKDLVSPLIVILKQVIEHKLPREFDYHRFPAPWIQVRLLEILSTLGRDDQQSSENMYEIISQTLRRADDTGINIGYAIVYQCLKTICTIYPNQHLIELASTTISRFLSSDSPNLRCTGINGLALIIQINPGYVMNHQQIIVDCLEENDETLKKNTFELLYKMTTLENVEVIVDKMMNYLKNTTLESVGKKDILSKITELAERFAPDKSWFIKIMNQLFVNFGDMITDEILSKLIKIINEWEKETDNDEEFKRYTIENYANIVENFSVLPDSLVKLMAWVIGEYSNKLYGTDQSKLEQILQMLCYLLKKTYDDEITKCMLISAIAKVHSNMLFTPLDFITEVIEKYSRDKNPEIQQRCLEYKRIQKKKAVLSKNQFTTVTDDLDIDTSLSFLDSFVAARVDSAGLRTYDKKLAEEVFKRFGSDQKELNYTPYQGPETILYVPGKTTTTLTSLFESKDSNFSHQVKSELKVQGPRVWDEGGYREEMKKVAQPVPVVNTINTGSVSSATVPVTVTNTFGRNDPFYAVSGPKLDDSNKNKTITASVTVKRNEPRKDDPRSYEKQNLMKGLFAGLSTKDKDTSSSPVPVQTQSVKVSTSSKQIDPSIDLLSLSETTKSPHETKTQTQTQTQTHQPNWNELDDILSGKQTTTVTTPPILFDSTRQPPTKNTNDNLFEALKATNPPKNSNTAPLLKTEYVQYSMSTDTFGDLWTKCPFDEKSCDMTSSDILTPEKLHSTISSKGNFYPVQIINNEAISAAKYKGKTTLVHVTVNGDGTLEVLIKCYGQELIEEIATFLRGIFK